MVHQRRRCCFHFRSLSDFSQTKHFVDVIKFLRTKQSFEIAQAYEQGDLLQSLLLLPGQCLSSLYIFLISKLPPSSFEFSTEISFI